MKSMTGTKEYGKTRLWIVVLAGLLAACFAFAATAETLPQDTIVSEQIEITVADDTPVGSMTNDELAAGYINSKMSTGRRLLKATRRAYDYLSVNEKLFYNYLLERIQEVANGERESTMFDVPLDNSLGGNTELRYTAEDLGIESIYDYWGDVPQTVADKMYECIIQQCKKAVNAIMSDWPYELYWYNKDVGTSFSAVGGYLPQDEYIYPNGSCTVGMFVSENYAIDPAPDGKNLRVDTQRYGQAVAPAIENAQNIVTQYESKNNYQRLLGYKNEICRLASYNDEAAQNPSTPYGDPWQLIWVFDGYDETKVVCEGYAKAFKYLNDQSKNGTASVILAEGTMNGGNHMWNIVTMEDGLNYLVDVTNCDDREDGYVGIGWPDLLFLAGAESGSVSEGYIFLGIGDNQVHYVYEDGLPFSDEQLIISSTGYLESHGLIPEFELTADGQEREEPYEIGLYQTVTFEGCAKDAASVDLQIWFSETSGQVYSTTGYTMTQAYFWDQPGTYDVTFIAHYADKDDRAESISVIVTADGTPEEAQVIVAPWHEGENLALALELDPETAMYSVYVINVNNICYQVEKKSIAGNTNLINLPVIDASELTSGQPVVVQIEQFAVGKYSQWNSVTICPIDPSGTLRLPESLLQIDEEAFMNDESITHVIIPEMVSEIASGAFQGCTALRTAEIPADVTGIADNAFPSSLETIYGYASSEAETYAMSHGISFVRID